MKGKGRFGGMEMDSTGKNKELYKDIDEILWEDWDPIGVNDLAPRDEYQRYTPVIFSLKISGANAETIANKLYEIEKDVMGLFGDNNRCRQVADKIINLK